MRCAPRAPPSSKALSPAAAPLLHAGKALAELKPENDEQRAGIDIVRRALLAPARQIAENSGLDGSIVVSKVLDSGDANQGFNARTGDYVDMIEAGILDPTAVVRLALQNASSVAGLLLTTEALIAP
jgi:chaperonin GroEL